MIKPAGFVDLAGFLLAIEEDIVTFQFVKKTTKSTRIAEGTRNMSLIPKEFHPKGTGSASSDDNQIKYFDWGRKQWRSFSIDMLFGNWKIEENNRKFKEARLQEILLDGKKDF